MPKKMFLKDMLFLLLGYVVILMFAFVRQLNIQMAIILLIMYVGYIVLVVVMEFKQTGASKKRKKKSWKYILAQKIDESQIGIEFQERSIISKPKEETGKYYEQGKEITYHSIIIDQ